MIRRLAVSVLAFILAIPSLAQAPSPLEDAYFQAGAARLDALKSREPISGRAKNVIVFIGDGMGVSTVTAARIRAGQNQGLDGESYELAMDRLPWVGLSRTYSHDFQTADSAATATAILAGVKTRSGVVGLDQTVPRGDCAAADGANVPSLIEQAEAAGLATGVVTTARITHATPAAAYAHSADRNWEAEAPEGCTDIAAQLIAWPVGDGLEVALGGGRSNFLPEGAPDPEDAGETGRRTDGRDLTKEWTAKSTNHVFAWNSAQFDGLDAYSDQKWLGLFERSHMEYEVDRLEDTAGEPSLAAMTAKAITRLSRDPEGYVLLVEGARIDHAHHLGRAGRALEDAIAFDAAIAAALDLTDPEETLILVTADHSHTLTIAGYAARGTSILGLARRPDGAVIEAADGKPYTTLGYINGPGAVFSGEPRQGRPDPSDGVIQGVNYRQQALVPASSQTHGGEDVTIYALGPQAHLVSGTLEQQVIYHILADALDFAD
ncbi:MAG: alkaline phosphatase [Maricaulaceae bacterium]